MKFINIRRVIFAGLAIIAMVVAVLLNSDKLKPVDKEPIKVVVGKSKSIALLGQSPVIRVVFESFKKEMTKEDKGSDFEYYDINVPLSRANTEEASAYIRNRKPDLIVTGLSEAQTLHKDNPDIPMIVVPTANAVKLGLAPSENGSKSNLVFIEAGNSEAVGKRLEFLKELLPDARRILVLRGTSDIPGENDFAMELLLNTARKIGITLIDKRFSTRKELNKFLLEYDFSQVDAIFRYPGPFMAANLDIFQMQETKINKPISVISELEMRSGGGVMSYGPDYENLGKISARIAIQILQKGVYAGDIPIQRPFDLILGINKKRANELGISIPAFLLEKADFVIE